MSCVPLCEWNGFRGIGGAAAKVVFAVGADAEVGGVAIEPRLEAGFERMARSSERQRFAGPGRGCRRPA